MSLRNVIDKAVFLKKQTLLADLPLDLLLAIAEKTVLLRFKEGEDLFRIGQEASKLYFILDGAIRIEGESNQLAVLYTGECFGEEALFSDRPRAYRAIAETPTTLLALSKMHLFTLIGESPTIALQFLHLYASQHPFRQRN